jgi:DNA-binding transcriptional regulator YhcF (GntR family)
MAKAGRQPDSDVAVTQLLDQYLSTAGWDVSTRESNLGYIHRTIKPALGSTQVRKVRGPLLDTLYARLMRCDNLACTGKPFTEHRNIPDLRPDPADRRLQWEQAADLVRAAIRSGQLASGDTLPSVPDLARLQGPKPGTVRHAYLALAEEGLVHIRHGRTTTIAGEPVADERSPRVQLTRPNRGHDCTLSGCRPHVCKPMAKGTIHGIHSILSGAFEAAMRWEWTDRNPRSRRLGHHYRPAIR